MGVSLHLDPRGLGSIASAARVGALASSVLDRNIPSQRAVQRARVHLASA